MKSQEKALNPKRKSMQSCEVLDVERLDAFNPSEAVRSFDIKARPRVVKCRLLIAGGGMGAVAAALYACEAGLDVCLTEQTSWLGGQMTSQGVSALDENYLVESSGATRSYKALRNAIREHYKSMGAREGAARFEPYLDPGNCWVSRLGFEAKSALKVLEAMLSRHLDSGRLQIFTRTLPVKVRKSEKKIRAVQCVDLDSGEFTEFRCDFCIDATELGDILPLAGVDYSSGAESRSETGEEHAPEKADSENVQDYTYPFVLEFCPGEKHLVEKPPHYDDFNEERKFSLNGYRMFENSFIVEKDGSQTVYFPFWEYRRLIAASNFGKECFANDLSMINWDSNDLRGQNIIDKPAKVAAERLALAKDLSKGFLYWLQTEPRRDDGGKGYPELKLRPDLLGTEDGLSKYPYIRESRRIKGRYTIVESDITAKCNPGPRARLFSDSLGIGLYPVDIHGRQDVPGAGQPCSPFQIPAAAMLQNQVRNLLPGCKNIACTHVTNGAYRLHPVEWAIGEAAASIAVEAISRKTDVRRLLANKRGLRSVQDRLLSAGAPLFWFDDLPPEDPGFAAGQFLSICALLPFDQNSLHFRPDDALSRSELAVSMRRLLRLPEATDSSLVINDMSASDLRYSDALSCLASKLLSLDSLGNFRPDAPVGSDDLKFIAARKELRDIAAVSAVPEKVSRLSFALWLYPVCKHPRFFGRH